MNLKKKIKERISKGFIKWKEVRFGGDDVETQKMGSNMLTIMIVSHFK